jgi:serine/threonine protein kinase
VQFLGQYRLGTAQGLRASGSGFSYFWYSSRGLEETCEPVPLKGRTPVTDNLLMLMQPERESAIYLSPFFHYGLTQGDRAPHVSWLHCLEERPDGKLVARYRHPVLRLDVVRGLPIVEDPDGPGISVDEYLTHHNDWPGYVELALAPESKAKLQDPLQHVTFHDRYVIVGKLGEGGMGVVYEAEDTLLKRRCALKMLHNDFIRSPQAVQRFLREGNTLARLDHPGVVKVFDVGITPDLVPYLVMSLVEGEDLESRLARAGPFTVDEAGRILVEVLNTLQAIHQADVVHRDIKPSNLILSAEGIKVVDFGIAALPQGTRLTQTMDRMGTLQYMAPEQGQGEFSPRSDIYACGRVLFSLLAGRTPKHPNERLAQAAAAPADLEEVYEIATAEAPSDRYATAAAMADAVLAAIRSKEPPEPSPAAPASPRDKTTAELFLRVEKTYPLPVAWAVRDLVLISRNAPPIEWTLRDHCLRTKGRSPTYETTVHYPLLAILQYLTYVALTVYPPRRGSPVVDTLREMSQSQLSLPFLAVVLKAVAQETAARGDSRLQEVVASPSFQTLTQAPSSLVVFLEEGVEHAHIRSKLDDVADLLGRVRFLADIPFYLAGAGGEASHAAGLPAVRAMGANSTEWTAEQLPVREPGSYLNVGGCWRSLSPLVRMGPQQEDLLLFCGGRWKLAEFLSLATWERVVDRGETTRRQIREALGLLPPRGLMPHTYAEPNRGTS